VVFDLINFWQGRPQASAGLIRDKRLENLGGCRLATGQDALTTRVGRSFGAQEPSMDLCDSPPALSGPRSPCAIGRSHSSSPSRVSSVRDSDRIIGMLDRNREAEKGERVEKHILIPLDPGARRAGEMLTIETSRNSRTRCSASSRVQDVLRRPTRHAVTLNMPKARRPAHTDASRRLMGEQVAMTVRRTQGLMNRCGGELHEHDLLRLFGGRNDPHPCAGAQILSRHERGCSASPTCWPHCREEILGGVETRGLIPTRSSSGWSGADVSTWKSHRSPQTISTREGRGGHGG